MRCQYYTEKAGIVYGIFGKTIFSSFSRWITSRDDFRGWSERLRMFCGLKILELLVYYFRYGRWRKLNKDDGNIDYKSDWQATRAEVVITKTEQIVMDSREIKLRLVCVSLFIRCFSFSSTKPLLWASNFALVFTLFRAFVSFYSVQERNTQERKGGRVQGTYLRYVPYKATELNYPSSNKARKKVTFISKEKQRLPFWLL